MPSRARTVAHLLARPPGVGRASPRVSHRVSRLRWRRLRPRRRGEGRRKSPRSHGEHGETCRGDGERTGRVCHAADGENTEIDCRGDAENTEERFGVRKISMRLSCYGPKTHRVLRAVNSGTTTSELPARLRGETPKLRVPPRLRGEPKKLCVLRGSVAKPQKLPRVLRGSVAKFLPAPRLEREFQRELDYPRVAGGDDRAEVRRPEDARGRSERRRVEQVERPRRGARGDRDDRGRRGASARGPRPCSAGRARGFGDADPMVNCGATANAVVSNHWLGERCVGWQRRDCPPGSAAGRRSRRTR